MHTKIAGFLCDSTADPHNFARHHTLHCIRSQTMAQSSLRDFYPVRRRREDEPPTINKRQKLMSDTASSGTTKISPVKISAAAPSPCSSATPVSSSVLKSRGARFLQMAIKERVSATRSPTSRDETPTYSSTKVKRGDGANSSSGDEKTQEGNSGAKLKEFGLPKKRDAAKTRYMVILLVLLLRLWSSFQC